MHKAKNSKPKDETFFFGNNSLDIFNKIKTSSIEERAEMVRRASVDSINVGCPFIPVIK